MNSRGSFFAKLALSLGMIFSVTGLSGAQLSPQEVAQFLANPSSLLANNPDGGGRLVSACRDLALSDPSTLPAITALLANANSAQQSALGSGLGQAATASLRTNPEFANQIQNALAASGAQTAIASYSAVTGNVQIGATGGGGGGGGGGGPTSSSVPTGGGGGSGGGDGGHFQGGSNNNFTGGGSGSSGNLQKSSVDLANEAVSLTGIDKAEKLAAAAKQALAEGKFAEAASYSKQSVQLLDKSTTTGSPQRAAAVAATVSGVVSNSDVAKADPVAAAFVVTQATYVVNLPAVTNTPQAAGDAATVKSNTDSVVNNADVKANATNANITADIQRATEIGKANENVTLTVVTAVFTPLSQVNPDIVISPTG